MKYSLKQCYYNDFNTLELNKLKPRSYFIPFKSFEEENKTTILNKRYSSSKVRCLNGIWDFKFYNNPNDLKEEIDTDYIDFDKLDVPSCIQYRGYSYPCYLNIRYPFPFKAPNVPTLNKIKHYFSLTDGFKKPPYDEYNHVSLYRTFFDVDDLNKNYIISFLGVCSCVEVYLNSEFIGYSEESHNTAEFDLTKFITKGKNELVCLVRRFSNGSYLECQDMFRNTGIFRDVLLRIEDKCDIYDIDFVTNKENGKYSASTKIILNSGNDKINVSIKGNGLDVNNSVKTINSEALINFNNLNVIEWNAEKPVLYDLYIESSSSFIHVRVGFKHIDIKGNIYYFNDMPIKLKGVNHHDTHPLNGYSMTHEDIKKDLDLCKKFNVNAIRTSHYAPDPFLIEYASEIGLYIIDENDIETHGTIMMKFPFSYNYLSNNKKWSKYYLDRIVRHYNRDKLIKTPIVLWSLGNEAGGGINTKLMYDYLKSVSDIPVQYESEIYTKNYAFDCVSRMYPKVSYIKDVGEGRVKNKKVKELPFFMCEYAHAMGVGPGNIEDYWDQIYKYPNLMGGCIWEMNDHAVYKNGEYLYGGDNKEWIHDSNFCCDGLFYPDRSPSTGAYIMKHAYRPLRIEKINNNEFKVFNSLCFTDTKNIKLVACYDNEIQEISLDLKPLETKIITLNFSNTNNIIFRTYFDTFLVDETTFKINNIFDTNIIFDKLPNNLKLNEVFPYIEYKDTRLEPSNLSTILFRSNTDNDKVNFFFETMPKWYDERIIFKNIYKDDYILVITSIIKANKQKFKIVDEYRGIKNGVLLSSTLIPIHTKGFLPRFGKQFKLDKTFENIKYYGREKESYIDMYEHSIIGEFSKNIKEMVEPNIKPQESGNRLDTKYVELSNGKVTYRLESFDSPFELSVKPYSDIELTRMKHRSDEVNTATYVTLSKFQQGIGTGSCGPEVLTKHKFKANKKYNINIKISWK